MSSTIDICQHIYDAATDLLQLLGEDIEEEREDRTDPTHAPRLLLASPTKPLVIDLIARGCSSAIAADLDHVYTREMQRLRSRLEDSLERDYRTALSIGKHADQNAVAQLLDALRGTYQKSMQGIAESCREQVLRLLDERGTKSGSIEASGFSEEALCILGAAWERSQSVNAGDCRALASATGLRPAQIQRWFNNRRTREKRRGKPLAAPSPRKGRKMEPRERRRVARKVSADSTSSSSDTSSVDLRSDSGMVGGSQFSWTPQLEASATSFDQADSIDRYLQGLQTPSPPSYQQSSYSPDNLFDPATLFANPLPAPVSLNRQPITSDPFSAISMPSTSQPLPLEQMQLPYLPHFGNPLSNLNIDAGIGDEFWRDIMAAAGLSLPSPPVRDAVDELKGVEVPPSAMDWSHVFLNLDAGEAQ